MKQLKKVSKFFVVAAVIAMLALGLVGCGGGGDIVGTWEMYLPEEDAAMLAMLGMEMSLTKEFNRNGNVTVSMDMFGISESETGTWETSGNILTISVDGDSDDFTFSISGNTLTLENDGDSVDFVRR